MFSTNSIFQVTNVRFRYSKYEISKKNTYYAVKYHKIFRRLKKKVSMFFDGGGNECTALSLSPPQYHD